MVHWFDIPVSVRVQILAGARELGRKQGREDMDRLAYGYYIIPGFDEFPYQVTAAEELKDYASVEYFNSGYVEGADAEYNLLSLRNML